MLWASLIVLLGTWCTGSSSQTVVTQLPSVSVSPGNTVKLSCTLSSGTSIGDYYVSWYQQKPGNSPRYLLYYYSDSSKGQGSGVPARFSGSKDSSSNAGYLTISGALAEDEADYYCSVIKSGTAVLHSDTDTWGTSSSQPVLTQPPSMTASPGQTVKISCSMSSGVTVQSYDQSWQQQTPGSPPRYLLYYYNSMSRGSGVPDRFSGSKESSSNVWYLTITNVQAEDEADYYCAVWYGSGGVSHSDTPTWGSETETSPEQIASSLARV
ncbi:immunoglobulin lambda-1 light chain-like [Malaclemys terrapin pileata]|uniref:immunoglobulin lambda-1 light chain-like n=1 Tax=Malaclemys terrapin pileata TaxID=2991368 RepID=UPI0023A8CF19|nr:immunoglobulin lambda-1 light chain-like [Malaclemys terrapin pileata]